ncbi:MULTISPECIES: SRPBCC family protein [unclassified Modestobacter]|uniref:SRPBCC family protein n=1 Tax=unclassified Modestobacter TaxID=2643866 RepID=UPI0022AA525C|nr:MULTISPECIES: carbon monoxide dehydrogenase subunit G [unclassified Modestobacter]MCZ2822789.1 carbon monoxide dehydrogenase subunit G [Modestobacter sp. VKM Ac-2981]MCZ2851035.1 carbon monoxide dehydrogenase subunit G [Modestobacter sp. VKM Ac-2982]
MNLDGSAVLSAAPEQVWAVITDPAVLARTIPGCESLKQVGEDSYTMVVSAGVGAIRGKYAGEVRLSDLTFPSSYVMHASGSGGPGSVRATVQIKLVPSGDGTELTYSADAVVGGAVAGVGQRMITGVAKKMAGQFFAAIDKELVEPNVVAEVIPIAADVPAGTPADAAPAPVSYATAPAAAGGWVPAEAKPLLVGAAGGGLLTLLGVWIGYLLGRRG